MNLFERLAGRIITLVPSVCKPIRLFIADERDWIDFKEVSKKQIIGIFPEQALMPLPRSTITLYSTRLGPRPILLDDVLRALILIGGTKSDEDYGDIIRAWDFNARNLDEQPITTIRLIAEKLCITP